MVMVFKYWLQMRWDRHGALSGVDRRGEDGFDDNVQYLLEYSSGDF